MTVLLQPNCDRVTCGNLPSPAIAVLIRIRLRPIIKDAWPLKLLGIFVELGPQDQWLKSFVHRSRLRTALNFTLSTISMPLASWAGFMHQGLQGAA